LILKHYPTWKSEDDKGNRYLKTKLGDSAKCEK